MQTHAQKPQSTVQHMPVKSASQRTAPLRLSTNPGNAISVAHENTAEVLRRQPAPKPTTPEIKLRVGWLLSEETPAETNVQVAALARLAIISLKEDYDDIDSASLKTAVTEWISTVNGVLPYFDREGEKPIDTGLIPLINYQYDELVRIREAIRIEGLIKIKAALWRMHDAAIKAAEEAEALQPALDDAMRAAYRKGSSNALKDVVSTLKSSISIGRNIRSLAADITKDIMGLPLASGTKLYVDHWSSQIGKPKITIINVGKYTEKLGTLGRGLSALNIALTIYDRSKKATAAEQGVKDLSDAFNIGTDAFSLGPLAMPPHFSLYSTLYLKPALKVISKQIGVLVNNLSDVNKVGVELTGNLLYPGAEPGGQEMFDLMVKVMHADSLTGVPALSEKIKTYLYDHRENLSAGAEALVPTEGSLFWKSLDPGRARSWLFANRKRIWAMFYGSMKVPGGN